MPAQWNFTHTNNESGRVGPTGVSDSVPVPGAVDSLTPSQRDLATHHKTQERQALLHELRRLEASGTRLTKNFGMGDSAAAMEFEIERHRIATDTTSSVQFMTDAIRLGLNGIELVNNNFGPFLNLDGWSGELTRDMSRFQPPLQRIYKRMFRRGAPSPFIELGFLIFGSMFTHHLQNKGGRVAKGATAAAAMFSGVAPTTNNSTPSIPFDMPHLDRGARPRRKTMARPGQAVHVGEVKPPHGTIHGDDVVSAYASSSSSEHSKVSRARSRGGRSAASIDIRI